MAQMGVMMSVQRVIDSVIQLTIHCGSEFPARLTRIRRHSSSDELRPILWLNSASSAVPKVRIQRRLARHTVCLAVRGFRAPC